MGTGLLSDSAYETKARIAKAKTLALYLISCGDDARMVANLDESEWNDAASQAGTTKPSDSTKMIVLALVEARELGAAQVREQVQAALY